MNCLISGLFLSILICNIHFTTGQPEFWEYRCGLTRNFTPDSDYKQDLDKVLTNSFLKTNNGFGFFNSSSGGVMAAAVCRGDLDPNPCEKCVDDATRRLRQVCLSQFEAVGWYDICFIRYSNRIMPNRGSGYIEFLLSNVSDSSYDQWNQAVETLLKTLRTEAKGGGELRKYASENVTVLDSLKIYGMMQCTPDFSDIDCGECLEEASDLVRQYPKSLGVKFYTPNCLIQYETDLFFNSTWFPPAPMQSLDPSPFLALSPLGDTSVLAASPSGKTNIGVIVVPVLVVLVVIVMVIGFFIFRRRQKLKRHAGPFVPEFQMGFGDNSPEGSKHEREDDDAGEINSFNLSTILVATNNFSLDNKIGEGGFGPVYKGKLKDGKEIAVKRLSSNSGQGLVEFKTEVQLIIKLQHKNLVRLLGYCVKGPERLLIYEFMVNNSLDTLIFELYLIRERTNNAIDPNKSKELDWPKRANIVVGIAKGLRYLHEDSRLKIIHRDMKAANILLDNEMDSKISDFGTARIFGGKQTEAATIRIVGTHGYMAPEYAMEGLFSTKSDVYSFGVLLLEIISGQRNTRFIYNDQPQNFLTTAWRLWKENKGEELIDRFLIQECWNNDALRWINIALLCVQEDPHDRPIMSTVVFMLEGQWSANLPTPSQPPASFPRFTASEKTTTTATRDASEPRSINLASSTTSSC